ncbi:uncharacterized protein LOC117140787 [Drosophila mauritiana]|uniref:Uncharacterized protein LOC117140787 n=1 Tax=Drosophila mauritiana TaxID=7226 RepID=A0A6P8JUH6_DROMA|nr:uncharacterized protein LOC117140787 [Drosophila mauritiana]
MKSLLFFLLVILCLVGMAPARRKKRDVEVWIRPSQNTYNDPCAPAGCE